VTIAFDSLWNFNAITSAKKMERMKIGRTHRIAFEIPNIKRSAAQFLNAAALAVCVGVSALSFSQSTSMASHQTDAAPLASVVKPYIDRHELAGAVILAANRNRVIDREAIGYADIANQRIMQPDNVFWIASMSKAITASAVLMLVDEGKLSLDDPVEKYLSEFKGQKVAVIPEGVPASSGPEASAKESAPIQLEAAAHPITVREILSHTAGLSFSSKREPGALDLLPLKSAVESYAAEPLSSQPGQSYSYSNEGFNTAGRIVEVVSGMPFETFLQKRLFDPLGMKDTTFWPSSNQLNRVAKSYQSGASGEDLREVPVSQLTYPLDDRQHRFPIPAGGLFSSADDVARFCQMMANNGTFHGKRYLSEESVRLITTKETPSVIAKPYGFGWNIGDGYFEHSGAYKTDMKVDRKRGLVIVFLVQRSGDWSTEDRQRLMDSLEQAVISNFGDRISVH
jgi:CubicO group peptidase (beta-lactamase class C family)